jgi:hypothetical protein
MSEFSIPKASDKTVKKTVIGYYRASNSGGEVTNEKAAEGAGISKDNLRRQKSFLQDIGALIEGDSGYALTETGQEIGRFLQHGREDDAKEPFGNLLREWEATPKILEDIGSGYTTKEEVLDSIGFITDHQLEAERQQRGADALIDLYVWTGILEESEDGEYRPVEVQESDVNPPESEGTQNSPVEEKSVDDDGRRYDARPNDRDFGDIPFEISLELTGTEDPENVQKLIVAIRAGLDAELNRDNESDTNSEGGQTTDSANSESSLDSFMTN